MASLAADLELALAGGEAGLRILSKRSQGFRLRDEESEAASARLTIPGLSRMAPGGSWLFLALGLVIVGAVLAIALRIAGVLGPSAAPSSTASASALARTAPKSSFLEPPVSDLTDASADTGLSAGADVPSAATATSASAGRPARGPATSRPQPTATASSPSTATEPKPRPKTPTHPTSGTGDVVDPWGTGKR
jgi:hypothetical protein